MNDDEIQQWLKDNPPPKQSDYWRLATDPRAFSGVPGNEDWVKEMEAIMPPLPPGFDWSEFKRAKMREPAL